MHLVYLAHTLAVFALGLSVIFLLPPRTANSQTTSQDKDDANLRASALAF